MSPIVNANLGCHHDATHCIRKGFHGVFQYLMASANRLSDDQAALSPNAQANAFKTEDAEGLSDIGDDISYVTDSERAIVVKLRTIAGTADKSKSANANDTTLF